MHSGERKLVSTSHQEWSLNGNMLAVPVQIQSSGWIQPEVDDFPQAALEGEFKTAEEWLDWAAQLA
jgi:hypothetical protein